MNFEVFALIPPPGHVIQIHVRSGPAEFRIGFCRQILIFGGHAQFIAPFRRAANAAMTLAWAERIGLGCRPIKNHSFGLCPEEGWMKWLDHSKTPL